MSRSINMNNRSIRINQPRTYGTHLMREAKLLEVIWSSLTGN